MKSCAKWQTAKNLWDTYDMIGQQFLAIQSFFSRVNLSIETHDVPPPLQTILVQILVVVLKICGIATGYAKKQYLTRSINLLLVNMAYRRVIERIYVS